MLFLLQNICPPFCKTFSQYFLVSHNLGILAASHPFFSHHPIEFFPICSQNIMNKTKSYRPSPSKLSPGWWMEGKGWGPFLLSFPVSGEPTIDPGEAPVSSYKQSLKKFSIYVQIMCLFLCKVLEITLTGKRILKD